MCIAPQLAELSPGDLRRAVADRYGHVAADPTGRHSFPVGRAFAEAVGYAPEVLDALPAAASASFAGVAHLPAWTDLRPGEVVVDLGCGAGLDALVAARAVGPTGRVEAVDLSEGMAALARSNAATIGLGNVAVHRAPVEAVPVADGAADAVVVNGVFNLSPEKERVAGEAFRLLRAGGRLVGAEIVLTREVPRSERGTLDDWFR